MMGVIWSVQLVQYPLFAQVGEMDFVGYHETHVQRISFVVVPLMLLELSSGALLLLVASSNSSLLLAFALLLVAWGATFLVQVPLHRELSSGRNAQSIRRLIRNNWIRTFAWTGRVVLLTMAAMSIGL